MAQPIKYNTGAKTANCCIKKGNYDIGVVSNYAYGPTSGTGFYAGYTIPSGGFVSYQNKASQGPSIYNIPSVDDLVPFCKNLNIGPVSSTTYCIRVCAVLNDITLVNVNYPELPLVDNNILTLDAGYTPSYPWTSTSVYSVAGGSVTEGTLNGGLQWFSGNSAQNYSDSYFDMNSTIGGQYVNCNAFGSALQNFTISVWINTHGAPNYSNRVCVVGQIYGAQASSNFAIRGNGTTGYFGTIRLGGTSYNVDFGSSIPDNNWVNLVLTYNGTSNEMKAYVDSVQRGAATGPGATLSSNGLNTIIGGFDLGTSGSGADTFNGYLNNVVIYNTTLEGNQIEDLYNAYKNQRGF
jgi:hypothetical protein